MCSFRMVFITVLYGFLTRAAAHRNFANTPGLGTKTNWLSQTVSQVILFDFVSLIKLAGIVRGVCGLDESLKLKPAFWLKFKFKWFNGGIFLSFLKMTKLKSFVYLLFLSSFCRLHRWVMPPFSTILAVLRHPKGPLIGFSPEKSSRIEFYGLEDCRGVPF